jgi:hypothetical protein
VGEEQTAALAARLDRHIATHGGGTLDDRVAALEALTGSGTMSDRGTLTESGSLSNSWTKNGGDGYFKYQRIGRLCFIFVRNLYPATTADGTVVLSAANGLPSSCRPAKTVSLEVNTNALKAGPGTPGVMTASLHFEADGSVTCWGIQMQATYVDCFGSFNIDAS